jgi:hypothetical protein
LSAALDLLMLLLLLLSARNVRNTWDAVNDVLSLLRLHSPLLLLLLWASLFRNAAPALAAATAVLDTSSFVMHATKDDRDEAPPASTV